MVLVCFPAQVANISDDGPLSDTAQVYLLGHVCRNLRILQSEEWHVDLLVEMGNLVSLLPFLPQILNMYYPYHGRVLCNHPSWFSL